ncbi:MAG: Rrf2 family transcriptional regulator [Rhodospirillaceae bacterium]|nr:MAG: Rrf2 family transcriptional regulator [Rhodospirillaceae bacterium]
MKLSTKGRYAVMAMVDISKSATGKPIALADVAERQEISLSYLEQLFGKLRRAELVKSVRGPGGGYLLARKAVEIHISDVILAVDEPISTTRCKNAKGCRSDDARCLTHGLWEALRDQIYLYLASVSLEDVAEGRVQGMDDSPEMHQDTQSTNTIIAAE